jgi:hypothetical protein
MKHYGFRLLDRDTQASAPDFDWFPTTEAREVAIQQCVNPRQHGIERIEKESPVEMPEPVKEGELGTERSSN